MDPLPTLLPDPPAGTLSRAVALRFQSDSLIEAGRGVNLGIRPSATASERNLDPSQGVTVAATALGLGVGESRFYGDAANEAFFTSRRLTLLSGGGTIAGEANASATGLAAGPTAAVANAINVAIAHVDWLSRGGDPLWIGTLDTPFLAQARAAGDSQSAGAGVSVSAVTLQAIARSRGLEGSTAADISPVPTFLGQPNAVVEAAATLATPEGAPWPQAGLALADAKGLEGYRVLALPADRGPSQVAGMATARVLLPEAPDQGPQPSAGAIGIDNSTILGPANGALRVVGEGRAWLGTASAARLAQPAGGDGSAALQGLGIHASTVMANGGDTEVSAVGGAGLLPAPTAASASLLPTASLVATPLTPADRFDNAGIDGSTIFTGQGNDRVEGQSLSQGSFDGIRRSTVNTGAGEDLIEGSANGSLLDAGQNDDTILLSRARDSQLFGGFGDDVLSVGSGSRDNQLEGGFGNDVLQVLGGQGNRLDGGFGQDQLSARDGTAEIFVQSEAGAALRAADSEPFAEQLTNPDFWSILSDGERETIWTKGTWAGRSADTSSSALPFVPVAGRVDVMQGFDPSRGDKLELSSSLAGITQALWDQRGTLFEIENGHLIAPALPSGASPPTAAIGMVVGSLEAIHGLGIGAPTLAYASDTRQLMYDADGDWSVGSLSIGSLSLAAPGAGLHKGDIRFNA